MITERVIYEDETTLTIEVSDGEGNVLHEASRPKVSSTEDAMFSSEVVALVRAINAATSLADLKTLVNASAELP